MPACSPPPSPVWSLHLCPRCVCRLNAGYKLLACLGEIFILGWQAFIIRGDLDYDLTPDLWFAVLLIETDITQERVGKNVLPSSVVSWLVHEGREGSLLNPRFVLSCRSLGVDGGQGKSKLTWFTSWFTKKDHFDDLKLAQVAKCCRTTVFGCSLLFACNERMRESLIFGFVCTVFIVIVCFIPLNSLCMRTVTL